MMMKHTLKRTLSGLMFCCLLTITATFSSAQDSSQSTAPDNTKVNDRDKSKSEPTADQQKNDKSDQDITQQIRKSVLSDKSLSTYAHNVKIISQNGMVTLKGPVRSADEKAAVESKAAAVVGDDKVTSELEVKPKQ
jgi:hyperosmotically inducible periplasmic protein